MPSATPHADFGQDANLDRIFRALGDPTRRAIIGQLAHGEATVSAIASQFDMTLPGVSKHVSVLEDAGLVDRWRTGRSRRCRLRIDRLRSASGWIATQTVFWNETLEALAALVEPMDENK